MGRNILLRSVMDLAYKFSENEPIHTVMETHVECHYTMRVFKVITSFGAFSIFWVIKNHEYKLYFFTSIYSSIYLKSKEVYFR